MISVKPKSREYYWATLFIGSVQRKFKYSLEQNKRGDINQPIQNLMTSGQRLTIQTSWDLPFKPNMAVEIDGELYKIISCDKLKTTLNECANRLFKPHNTFWIMDLSR